MRLYTKLLFTSLLLTSSSAVFAAENTILGEREAVAGAEAVSQRLLSYKERWDEMLSALRGSLGDERVYKFFQHDSKSIESIPKADQSLSFMLSNYGLRFLEKNDFLDNVKNYVDYLIKQITPTCPEKDLDRIFDVAINRYQSLDIHIRVTPRMNGLLVPDKKKAIWALIDSLVEALKTKVPGYMQSDMGESGYTKEKYLAAIKASCISSSSKVLEEK